MSEIEKKISFDTVKLDEDKLNEDELSEDDMDKIENFWTPEIKLPDYTNSSEALADDVEDITNDNKEAKNNDDGYSEGTEDTIFGSGYGSDSGSSYSFSFGSSYSFSFGSSAGPDSEQEIQVSKVIITLMRGSIQREDVPDLWNVLLDNQLRIDEYVGRMGLKLIVDRSGAYAFLRQQDREDLPRLVPRRQLSYGLSLLLVTLRRQLSEYDSSNGDSIYVVSKQDLYQKLKGFFPQLTNETKYISEIDRHINRAEEMGFIKQLSGQDNTYSVRPILKSFVTAEWLETFSSRLKGYIEAEKQAREWEEEVERSGLI